MKYLKTIAVLTVFLLSTSCGFFGKGDKDKPSLMDIGKQLAKQVKKQQKKNNEKMDIEFEQTKGEEGDVQKFDAKTIELKEEHFDVSIKNLDSAIDNLKNLNKDIEEKTKDGNFSAFDAFALVGKMSGFATGYSTEYIDKNFEGSERNEMKAAFSKIMGMYMIDSTITNGEQTKTTTNEKDFDKMKEQIANMNGTDEEKEQASKSLEEMENQIKTMQEYTKNPLKDYKKEDVEKFKKFKPEITEKVKTLKAILKKMGDSLKSVKK